VQVFRVKICATRLVPDKAAAAELSSVLQGAAAQGRGGKEVSIGGRTKEEA
jgi:hypothetical protein